MKIQASKHGDAQGTPTLHQQPSGHFVETTFLSLYILCVILGASFYFALSFVLFVILLVIFLLDPCFICVGERHAPLFHLNTPVLRLYLVEYSRF